LIDAMLYAGILIVVFVAVTAMGMALAAGK